MRSNNVILVLWLWIIPSAGLQAQYEKIPTGYYSFPIMPERPNYLSGTMGELRSSHFHAGLDIKTNGKEGYRVYAAADGYISRIRIGPGGYGNAVYINHPNGTTTVYGHLKRLKNPELVKYILSEHYTKQSHALNLFPASGAFQVKKGEVIAITGNSVSSSGPHLHFEIRTASQEVLDPLKIGFDEIEDDRAPIPASLAAKTMDIESRVNGQFGYFTFTSQERTQNRHTLDTVYAFGNIGLELYSYDQHNGSNNKNGVSKIDLYLNDDIHFAQSIDTINFGRQKNIKIHSNYQGQKITRARYGKLYVDYGNPLDYYYSSQSNGLLNVSVGDTILARVELEDAYQNESALEFMIIGTEQHITEQSSISSQEPYYVQDHTLVLQQKATNTAHLRLVQNSVEKILSPDYTFGTQNFYLVNLKEELPQQIIYGDQKTIDLNFGSQVLPARNHTFLADTYSIQFGKKAVFDTIYMKSKHSWTDKEDILEINEDIYPLKESIQVEWIPQAHYDDLSKYAVYQINNPNFPSYRGGQLDNGVIKFNLYRFGKFTLLKDDKKPSIELISSKNNRVYFRIKDDLSGIKRFRAQINGEWLLMHYEPKRSLIWSERIDKNKPLQGEFELKVSDNAGNESIFKLKL